MRVEIFTRSMNYELYDAAMRSVSGLPYKRHRLRSQTADGYLRAMLRSGAEWAINIDEDALVTDVQALEELLEYCKTEGIVNCGMQDGGLLPVRKHNPLVTNPFFNIINLAELRKYYSAELVEQYAVHKTEYEKRSPQITGEYSYDYFEPYCAFFVWVSQNFKTLYLNGTTHPDGTTTVLENHRGKPFVVHTWYSRFYGVDKTHTDRINRLIDQYSSRTKKSICRRISDKIANEITYPIKKKLKL